MKLSKLVAGLACAFAASLSMSAQVLMLDFGPTPAADESRLSSPYHSVNTSFTDTRWNTLGTSDASSGLFWSNHTAATGISVNLGATTEPDSMTIGLDNTPSNGTGLLGNAMSSTTIYANSAPARDGIFTGTSNASTRYVGLQVQGLAAGTYTIYITGRNTNINTGHEQVFYAGKSASAGDFNATSLASQSLTYYSSPTVQNNSWQGSGGLANYATFTVTLTSGEFLNLAVRGGASEARGFLNSVQIVNPSAIPEASTTAFFAGLLAVAGAVGLRRRR